VANGGSPIWVSGSYDPTLNLSSGAPDSVPDFVGDNREGDNLYSDSIVALDIDTGKMKWHFQNTPHDVHDWDSLEMPVLLDARSTDSRASPPAGNRNGASHPRQDERRFLRACRSLARLTG
jgi:alcohol dehydrogenase (cytochrome c)